ncbi:hypothetical protein [Alistipes sp. ZOR0009]|jgi:hypothetical protein|uniref:hypothetical protein n=1 Tax=Alistipes sp. ZOR0009 TaxID=1339253 RepID=UPI000A7520F6|nr:hypothetical protein [Alistipes sp. ZOR0009]
MKQNKSKKSSAELEITFYTCNAVKNGISYLHKFPVLWLNYKHNNSSYLLSLN